MTSPVETAELELAAIRHPHLPPEHRFYCRLDDQPGFLVPSRLYERPAVNPADLKLNAQCWWSGMGPAPAWIDQLANDLDLRGVGDGEVWVADNARRCWHPFSVGQRFSSILRSLLLMGVPATAIDADAVDILRAAGILLDPQQDAARDARIASECAGGAREYSSKGYTEVSEVLHPFHLGALRRYFRQRVRAGAFNLGDQTSRLRFVAHNERIARFFHRQLTPIVSRIAGEPLKPSYVYFASYRGCAELRRHIDRPQCAHTLTFLLDYTPEPVSQSPWPLLLHLPEGQVSLHQAIGDGIVYRGPMIPHERHRLSEHASSASIFFHYVSRDFSGSLD